MEQPEESAEEHARLILNPGPNSTSAATTDVIVTLRDYGGGDLASYFNSRSTGIPGALTAILSSLAPAGSAAACALPATPPLPEPGDRRVRVMRSGRFRPHP